MCKTRFYSQDYRLDDLPRQGFAAGHLRQTKLIESAERQDVDLSDFRDAAAADLRGGGLETR